MNHRGNYIRAALVILIVTFRYAGISSALGRTSNVKNQTEDKTGVFHNTTLRNVSWENCDTLAGTNVSTVGENNSSHVLESLKNESPFPDRKNKYIYVTFTSLAICLGIWSVVANSLPLAAIIKQEQLHTPVYILMANLAASDVLAGIAFMFTGSSVLYLIDNEILPSPVILRVRFMFIVLSGLSSAYGLMALTAERYWFIVHGMTYVNNVTNDKCKVVIAIIWVWSISIAIVYAIFGRQCAAPFEDACLPTGGSLAYAFVAPILVIVFIPIAAIILFNMGVFRCLWMQVNAINAQEAAVGAPPSVSRKSAITIVLITVVFLVGWLPVFINMAVAPEDIAPYFVILIVLNSAINPVIYGFRLGEVRRGVVRLFVSNNHGNAIFPVD